MKKYVAIPNSTNMYEAEIENGLAIIKGQYYELDKIAIFEPVFENDNYVRMLVPVLTDGLYKTKFSYITIDIINYNYAINLIKLFYKDPYRFTHLMPNMMLDKDNITSLSVVTLLKKVGGFDLKTAFTICRNTKLLIEEYIEEIKNETTTTTK